MCVFIIFMISYFKKKTTTTTTKKITQFGSIGEIEAQYKAQLRHATATNSAKKDNGGKKPPAVKTQQVQPKNDQSEGQAES